MKLPILFLLAFFFSHILSLHADVCTWNGLGDGVNWSDGNNWSCGHAPVAVDAVVINNAAVTLNVANAMIASLEMNSSQLSGSNNISISGALSCNTVNLGGSGTMTVAGMAMLSNTTNLDARTLTLNGNAEVNGAINAHNNANLVINGTMTSTTVGNHAWGGSGGLLTLNGTFIRNGSGYIAFDSYIFQNSGTITVNQGDFYLGFYGYNGTHNGATFNIAAGTFFGPNGGTHTFTGCTINGSGFFGAGANISTFTGNTVAGTMGMSSWGGTFTLGQDLSITSWMQFPGGTVDGTSNITLGGNLTQTGGTFSPNGNVTVNGTLAWSGGTIGGTGTMTIVGTATVTNNPILNARTLTLDGDGTVAGSFQTSSSANLVINQTLTVTTSGNTAWGGSGGILTLAGTLIKAGPGFLAFDTQTFQNTGTVTVNQGEVYLGFFGYNGTHNGATFNIAAGSYFVPNGGTHTFTGCTFNGLGVFGSGGAGNISTFTGNTVASKLGMGASGTFTLGQDLNIGYWEQYSGGVVNGNSNINLSGNFIQTGGTISNNGNWSVNGIFTMSSGTINNTGNWNIANDLNMSGGDFNSIGSVAITGNANFTGGGFLRNAGTVSINGNLYLDGGGLLGNAGDASIGGNFDWIVGSLSYLGSGGVMTVAGLTTIPSGVHNMYTRTLILNGGGTFSGQSINMGPSAVFRIPIGQTLMITSMAGLVINQNFGGPNLFDNQGILDIGSANPLNITCTNFSNSGTIQGNGTINVAGTNFTNTGIYRPGSSTRILTTDLFENTGGGLDIEIGGITAGVDYDQLKVTGAATLGGGDVNLNLVNSYTPQVGHSFTILEAVSVSGMFATPTNVFEFGGYNWSVEYDEPPGSGDVVLKVISLLPLELLDFQAFVEGTQNQLNWRSASEANFSHYEIERSPNGKTWSKLGKVVGAENASEEHFYRFADLQPLTLGYYRLGMVDVDGSKEFSKIVSVERQGLVNKMLISPNPFEDKLELEFEAKEAVVLDFSLIDMTGRSVLQAGQTLEKGQNRLSFEVSSLPQGIYSMLIQSPGWNISERVVKL